jgi:hypothetical protein
VGGGQENKILELKIERYKRERKITEEVKQNRKKKYKILIGGYRKGKKEKVKTVNKIKSSVEFEKSGCNIAEL